MMATCIVLYTWIFCLHRQIGKTFKYIIWTPGIYLVLLVYITRWEKKRCDSTTVLFKWFECFGCLTVQAPLPPFILYISENVVEKASRKLFGCCYCCCCCSSLLFWSCFHRFHIPYVVGSDESKRQGSACMHCVYIQCPSLLFFCMCTLQYAINAFTIDFQWWHKMFPIYIKTERQTS